jgi:hypothetical protein
MIRSSEASEAAALPAHSIERSEGLFCDDAADSAPSLMPSEAIVPDKITGLSRARHFAKLVRQ